MRTSYPLVTGTVDRWATLTAWIFQVAGTLTIAAGKNMVLAGGALTKNIVWAVTGVVTTGAGSHIEGVILGKTGITLETGTTANSRLLSQGFVTLQEVCLVL